MPNPVAQNHLHDIDVSEIALCKQGAVPKATFLIKKSVTPDDSKDQFTKQLTVVAKDDVKKQIFTYALVPDEPDLQGDVVTKADIEAAQLSFGKNLALNLQKGQGTSDTHANFGDIGHVFTTVIDPDGSVAKAYGVDVDKCVPGGWFVGVQCSDTSWDKVQKGEFNAVSIGGQGARTPVQETTQKTLLKKISDGLEAIGKALGVSKAEGDPVTFDAALSERQTTEKLWDLEDALWKSIRSILKSDATNKSELVAQTIDQYKAAMLTFVASLPTDGAEMTKALEPLDKILKSHEDMITKANGDTDKGDTAVAQNNDAIVKALGEVQKSLGELTTMFKEKDSGKEPKPVDANKSAVSADADADDPVLKAISGLNETLTGLKDQVNKALSLPAGTPGSEETVEGGDAPVQKSSRFLNLGGGGPQALRKAGQPKEKQE